MSDGDSVSGGLKDLGKETGKQVASFPKTFIKAAITQVVNRNSEEEEARKQAEKIATHHRIQAIEAEMSQIRAQSEQKEGPSTQPAKQELSTLDTKQKTKQDEASRQAVGKAEQGRNFKG